MDPYARIREVLTEIGAITAKTAPSADELRKLGELTQEGEALKATIETLKRGEGLTAWAGKSAGMLPLVGAGSPGAAAVNAEALRRGAAVVERITPAGATQFERVVETVNGRRMAGLELLDQYGEGLISPEQWVKISTPEYREAFKSYIRFANQRNPEAAMKAEHLKVLQEGSDTAGGYLVPEDILNRLVQREATPTGVAARVTQLQTSRDSVVMPKVNYSTDNLYTSGMRVTWTGEVPSSSTVHRVTEPVFGQIRIPIYTAMMSIPLTNDMVEDSAFPIVSWVSGKFGETIDLLRDNMILNGSGIAQPAGILVNPGAANNPAILFTGAAATYTAAGLIAAGIAIPPQYDSRTAWVMSKTSSAAAIAGLVDLNGRPIWSVGFQDTGLQNGYMGRPLVGYPVVYSEFMPAIGAGNYSAIIGDLSGYYLVNRVGLSVRILNELYAETNQILILGRVRFGGEVAEDWKLRILQCHV